ncbi:MAG: hypothetical protein ACRD8W_11785 [Nitrososphaeraceae archaeon]
MTSYFTVALIPPCPPVPPSGPAPPLPPAPPVPELPLGALLLFHSAPPCPPLAPSPPFEVQLCSTAGTDGEVI